MLGLLREDTLNTNDELQGEVLGLLHLSLNPRIRYQEHTGASQVTSLLTSGSHNSGSISVACV